MSQNGYGSIIIILVIIIAIIVVVTIIVSIIIVFIVDVISRKSSLSTGASREAPVDNLCCLFATP